MQLLLRQLLRIGRALRKGPKAPARIAQNGTVEWLETYLASGQLTGAVIGLVTLSIAPASRYTAEDWSADKSMPANGLSEERFTKDLC